MPDDSSGIICGSDVNRLVDLFLQFEGVFDPLSTACKEAEQQFDALVEKLYAEKVVPNGKFQSITLVQFRIYTRKHCRRIAVSNERPYSCF